MRQRRLKNEINVVPYIDVMLVLLVIFMVATPMMTTGSVNLPPSGSAPQKPDKYVKVQIDEKGSLSVFDSNGKETKQADIKQLRVELRRLKEESPDMPLLISGDKETLYKNVTEILDETKKAGFSTVALETSSK